MENVIKLIGVEEFPDMIISEACDAGYTEDHMKCDTWPELKADTFDWLEYQKLVDMIKKGFKIEYIIK